MISIWKIGGSILKWLAIQDELCIGLQLILQDIILRRGGHRGLPSGESRCREMHNVFETEAAVFPIVRKPPHLLTRGRFVCSTSGLANRALSGPQTLDSLNEGLSVLWPEVAGAPNRDPRGGFVVNGQDRPVHVTMVPLRRSLAIEWLKGRPRGGVGDARGHLQSGEDNGRRAA